MPLPHQRIVLSSIENSFFPVFISYKVKCICCKSDSFLYLYKAADTCFCHSRNKSRNLHSHRCSS